MSDPAFAGPQVVMDLFCVYRRPKDAPEKFVVRRWLVLEGRADPVPELWARLADTVEAARELIPPGYVRLGRSTSDDPVIVETWL